MCHANSRATRVKGAFEIEIIGDRRRATVITEPPFDPQAQRMRM
jgi:dimethylglycine dehydrogenase